MIKKHKQELKQKNSLKHKVGEVTVVPTTCPIAIQLLSPAGPVHPEEWLKSSSIASHVHVRPLGGLNTEESAGGVEKVGFVVVDDGRAIADLFRFVRGAVIWRE